MSTYNFSGANGRNGRDGKRGRNGRPGVKYKNGKRGPGGNGTAGTYGEDATNGKIGKKVEAKLSYNESSVIIKINGKTDVVNNDITINGDGLQTRTFCYIDDNLDATINALEANIFNNEIINIGNDKEVTIIKLAELIKKLTGSQSKIVHREPLEEGDMTRRQPDINRMKKLLKRDFTDLSTGLEKVIDSFKKKNYQQ